MTISSGAPETAVKPRHFDIQLAYVAGVILALLLLYTGFTFWLVNDPETSRSKDFIHFYAVGTITRQFGISHIYDLDLQKRLEETQVGHPLSLQEFLPYNHVPYTVPLVALVVNENYESSFLRWILVLTGIILASIAMLVLLLPVEPRPWRWLFAGSLLFLPVLNSITMGQDSAFILLGLAVFLWGISRGHANYAGLGLSLLTLRPQMVIFFVIPLFLWSRPAFRAYILGCGALTLISLLMIGRQGVFDFIQVMQISVAGEGYGMNEIAMFNLLGLAHKLFPGLDAALARQLAWGLFILTGLGVAIFFALSKISYEKKFALSLLAYLMTSPHLHYHELVILIVPAFIIVREISQTNAAILKKASLIAATISLAMFVIYYKPVYYAFPYLLVGLLAYGLLRRADIPISSPTLEKSVG